MYSQKRGNERIARKGRIKLTVYPLKEEKGFPLSIEARLEDVSCGGLCVQMPLTLEKDDEVRISMDLPSSQIVSSRLLKFETEGVVRWSRNVPEKGVCRLGIEFKRPSKAAQEAWQNFIGRNRPSLF